MIKKVKKFYQYNTTNRTAFNTIVIYVQRFFAAFLALATTPLILQSLGVEDYGLYAITIGFVGMLSILNWSLANATQRYTAFAIGEKNIQKLRNVFSTALVIHFVYGILIFIIICLISVFFVDNFLNIPPAKIELAKNVLFIVAFISFISILAIPFIGILKAEENYISLALVGIIESICKLLIAILLFNLLHNKLIIYAFMLLIVTIISFCIYIYVVKRNYKAISISSKHYSKDQAREVASFLSWSLLGSLSLSSRNEGVQVILNVFFGVAINAAYGIAMQVNSAISILSQGVLGSISPQIIKSAGQNDHSKMIFLMRTMSKFSIFSISLFAIPLFFECETILNLWLGKLPDSTVIFVRLFIIFSLVMLMSAGLLQVLDALGKVKEYNIWTSLILLLNLPIAYVLFEYNFPPYTIIIIAIFLELISFQLRLFLLNKYIEFSIVAFYLEIIKSIIFPILLTSILIFLIRFFEWNYLIQLFSSFIVTFLLYPFLIFAVGLDRRQKELLVGLLNQFKLKK